MGEYMFGVTRDRLPAREVARRDRICRAEGGYGYTQIREAGGGWLGWYSGPNQGAPFDARLAARVAEAIQEGIR